MQASGFPATATLTSGVGTFSVTLKTAGGQTLTASDGAITTTSNPAVTVTTGAVTHFSVNPATSTPTVGTPFNVTVTALDGNGNTVTTDNGTVTLSTNVTNPTGVSLPDLRTLSSGVFTFSVTLTRAAQL